MEKSTVACKQEIRSRYLGYRNELSMEERMEKSDRIREHLMREPVFERARTVLVYMDYRSEVMTTRLVEELLAEGTKRVFAPKVEGMDIAFYQISSMDDLTEGYQGIREPLEDSDKCFRSWNVEKESCLILVPGSVFDRQGGRMGYGKGFYDRFLEKVPSLYSVGLAFECQVAARVPVENHDRKIRMLVTETGAKESGS